MAEDVLPLPRQTDPMSPQYTQFPKVSYVVQEAETWTEVPACNHLLIYLPDWPFQTPSL